LTRRFDLIAFDVDGTLVTHGEGKTVWEVLNDRFLGSDRVNRERYALYRAGRLSYADWVSLDVEGWRAAGATRESMVEALGPLSLMDGTLETLGALREHGSRLVVISGTLDLLLDAVLPGDPFDEVYANRLEFDANGGIRGWTATPYDMEGKETLLRSVAERDSIPLSRCAFVGDSANDLWVARAAGFAVALNPKSAELEAEADAVVRSDDLKAILAFLL
jgi:HAD superfamily phosphoserine phosphatase-like hydrolase